MRFLTGFVLAAAVFASLIYWVNPVRDFGGRSVFPPARSDYRNEKIELLRNFGDVDGLILGSSRSMLLSGARIAAHSDVLARIFNFGVASAKAEDLLATWRWTMNNQRRAPRTVFIGVDIESLRDEVSYGDSIHPLRELATGSTPVWEQFSRLGNRYYTWSYAKDLAYSIARGVTGMRDAVQFAPDGSLIYIKHDQNRLAGRFDLEAGFGGCMTRSRNKIESTARLSPRQVSYLRELVQDAHAAGASVVLWLTGPHPRVVEHISAGTSYLELLSEARRVLQELPAKRFFDFHDSRSYSGSDLGWYDCNHFDRSHADRIEPLLAREVLP